MAAAGIEVQVGHGATGTPAYASAEAPGALVFNRQDAESAGAPVIIPSPGNGLRSSYSNYKALRLAVVVAGTTNIANFRVRKATAESAGLRLFVPTAVVATYAQCTGTAVAQGNRPADTATALAAAPHPNTPATYEELPVSPAAKVFDAGSYATATPGLRGNVLQLLLGVSDQYAGGPSSAASLPTVTVVYDEA